MTAMSSANRNHKGPETASNSNVAAISLPEYRMIVCFGLNVSKQKSKADIVGHNPWQMLFAIK
jgi:hypothetical protein